MKSNVVLTEIGSDFWDVPIAEKENYFFPRETKWFLSGRHALEYVVIDSGIKSVSMPKWCCDSMVSPFRKNGVKVEFYDEKPNYSLDAVFLIDYFGFAKKKEPNAPKSFKGVVIRDVTHSLLSKKYNDADYYFGSLRKWAGFATGGFAWGKWKTNISIQPYDTKYVDLRLRAFELKKQYIEKGQGDKSFLSVFKEANDSLDNIGICGAFPGDIEKAKHLDIEKMKTIRRSNAKKLITELNLPITMGDNDVPLFVPIFVENRDALRHFLIEKQVYCPVHWPSNDVDGTELSLVCDQRYSKEDMELVVSLIKEFEAESRAKE